MSLTSRMFSTRMGTMDLYAELPISESNLPSKFLLINSSLNPRIELRIALSVYRMLYMFHHIDTSLLIHCYNPNLINDPLYE